MKAGRFRDQNGIWHVSNYAIFNLSLLFWSMVSLTWKRIHSHRKGENLKNKERLFIVQVISWRFQILSPFQIFWLQTWTSKLIECTSKLIECSRKKLSVIVPCFSEINNFLMLFNTCFKRHCDDSPNGVKREEFWKQLIIERLTLKILVLASAILGSIQGHCFVALDKIKRWSSY